MTKRLVAVIATIVLAIGGVTALVFYANGAEQRAFAGAELVDVLRVTETVPSGTPAADVAGSVETVELPSSAVADDVMTSLADAGDRVTAAQLVPGEVLLAGKFVERSTAPKGEMPEGFQAISIQVGVAAGAGGKIAKGDLVGVLGNYENAGKGRTGFVAERVQVLEIDQGLVEAEGSGAAVLATLAVEGDTAAKISHAASFGTIWLTKQTIDTDRAGSGVVDMDEALR